MSQFFLKQLSLRKLQNLVPIPIEFDLGQLVALGIPLDTSRYQTFHEDALIVRQPIVRDVQAQE